MPVDDPTGDENLLNTETYYWDDPAQMQPAGDFGIIARSAVSPLWILRTKQSSLDRHCC